MSKQYYMGLEGVGQWQQAIKQVGAQLRPYQDFLKTAIEAEKERKLVLGWRKPEKEEEKIFEERLEQRYQQKLERAKNARKRRNRKKPVKPSGQWIVLEPPPWRQEEPDDTFDAFLNCTEVYDDESCRKDFFIRKVDFDREGRAILLDELPDGDLIWLRPNTYTLDRQLHAVWDLENKPSSRLAPLVRLTSTSPIWSDVDVHEIADGDWMFLKTKNDSPVREGTDEQRRFVAIAMATPDFALLEGPPGSGKTTAICELIAQLVLQGKRILLVASTHVAVDNVLERLLEHQDDHSDESLFLPVRIGDEGRVTSDGIIPWIYKNLLHTWRSELLDFLDDPGDIDPAGNEARNHLRRTLKGKEGAASIERLILESANVVCGTTIGILQHPAIKASRNGQSSEPFDIMILDEASKTTFTEFLVPALHAKRWVVVGDIKQLSPYVEESELADNLRGLISDKQASAAVHAFLAAPGPQRHPFLRTLLATDENNHEIAVAEASARNAHFIDLNSCSEISLNGIDGCIPELLYADLVIGNAGVINSFEHRLPIDLQAVGGELPALPGWEAARQAYRTSEGKRRKRRIFEEDEPIWGSEMAWRLIRSYELRQNKDERKNYEDQIQALIPKALEENDRSDKRRLRNGESPQDALLREIRTVRRVALPSILELLQTGFERLEKQRDAVALTDGLPAQHLRKRLVSLSFQHRMHPHISAFSRDQFYTKVEPLSDREAELHKIMESSSLLRDSKAVLSAWEWSYSRYAKRALWIDVNPKGGGKRRGNINTSEADIVLKELLAFVKWAKDNPRKDRQKWEVAILTFYRGQESELRERLQEITGQYGNSRNFHLPKGKATVHITLCTVDRFQGHEADVVFLSFVKSGTTGFLNSPNRLNVALTRARYQIVLIGHQTYFKEQNKSQLLKELANSKHYASDISWG